MRTFLPSFALAAGVALASLTAAPRPAAAQSAQANDVVMLRGGGLVRGTISEYVPGSHVTIVTVAGDTKRIGAGELTYAGPAANAPGAPRGGGGQRGPAGMTVNAPEAPVQIRADEGDVTFHVRTGESTGSAVTTGFGMGYGFGYGRGAMMPSTAFTSVHGRSYGRICTAPCEASVPAGTYPMALSKGNGSPIEAEEPVQVTGPSTLQGTYTSYAALRTTGTVISIASVLGGAFLVFTSFDRVEKCEAGVCQQEIDVDSTKLVVGGVVLIGGAIAGGIMASKSDEATIRVLPAASGALPGRATAWGSDRSRAPAGGALPGLSVAVTF
ncbi:MAG TPA: hypothetical protein VFS43_45970 [Polyangiaceae bacterium]|nr:hypothetical protein [Polyangiaceae bacterium]